MNNKKKLIEFFKLKNWKRKPDGITWDQIGKDAGISSGEAARSIWRRNKAIFKYPNKYKSPAKILIFDLETSPNLSWTWRTFKENIAYNQIEQNWFILTWSAKWLFEDEIMSDKLTPGEVFDENDSRIVKSLWKLVNEADVIVAHNLLGFDQRRLHTRFLLNSLELPKPYTVIDTLIHARKHLAFTSNRLDALGQILGVGQKIDTGGFDLWKKCMKGDEEALSKMESYNRGDVQLLEDVYLAMQRYIKPHPNLGLLQDNSKLVCATCGSDNLEEHGEYHTTVSVFQAYKCNNCGSLSRSRKQTKINKDYITVSLPK